MRERAIWRPPIIHSEGTRAPRLGLWSRASKDAGPGPRPAFVADSMQVSMSSLRGSFVLERALGPVSRAGRCRKPSHSYSGRYRLMNKSASLAIALVGAVVLTHGALGASEAPKVSMDQDGTVHLPDFAVPPSVLETVRAKENFRALVDAFKCEGADKAGDITAIRKEIDECLMRPGIRKLRATFSVDIKAGRLGGVPIDSIEPTGGVAPKNKRRVLVNLHGGAFSVAAGLGGQMESIPIAALGAIKVISVDYREGPENRFPAASEDVAAIYSALLKDYPASNIGIYGCSAGGILTAESMAWFQTHSLPRPGAIGIFGAGAVVPFLGDSTYVGPILMGMIPVNPDVKASTPYFDVPNLNVNDPLVSPVYSPHVLSFFPPTLLISGTRDAGLSSAVYTHTQLVKQGVEADLHIWEGASHCSFAQPVADPEVPETREAWDVIAKFFDKRLGR